jgi:hypothetical protein
MTHSGSNYYRPEERPRDTRLDRKWRTGRRAVLTTGGSVGSNRLLSICHTLFSVGTKQPDHSSTPFEPVSLTFERRDEVVHHELPTFLFTSHA